MLLVNLNNLILKQNAANDQALSIVDCLPLHTWGIAQEDMGTPNVSDALNQRPSMFRLEGTTHSRCISPNRVHQRMGAMIIEYLMILFFL